MDSTPPGTASPDASDAHATWWTRARPRIARAVAIGGLLIVGGTVARSAPREVSLRYDLGAAHMDIDRVEITYLTDGEAVQRVTLRYPGGAPRAIDHHVRVAPGRYDVELRLHGAPGEPDGDRGRGGTNRARAFFDAPADGVVRITPRRDMETPSP